MGDEIETIKIKTTVFPGKFLSDRFRLITVENVLDIDKQVESALFFSNRFYNNNSCVKKRNGISGLREKKWDGC